MPPDQSRPPMMYGREQLAVDWEERYDVAELRRKRSGRARHELTESGLLVSPQRGFGGRT